MGEFFDTPRLRAKKKKKKKKKQQQKTGIFLNERNGNGVATKVCGEKLFFSFVFY